MTDIYTIFLSVLIKIQSCIGFIILTALMILTCLNLLNKIFRITRYILMYEQYKKNEDLYELRNKAVIDTDGNISFTLLSPEEIETALENAINNLKRGKVLREKHGKKHEK